jgi:hypothetical protein
VPAGNREAKRWQARRVLPLARSAAHSLLPSADSAAAALSVISSWVVLSLVLPASRLACCPACRSMLSWATVSWEALQQMQQNSSGGGDMKRCL